MGKSHQGWLTLGASFEHREKREENEQNNRNRLSFKLSFTSVSNKVHHRPDTFAGFECPEWEVIEEENDVDKTIEQVL